MKLELGGEIVKLIRVIRSNVEAFNYTDTWVLKADEVMNIIEMVRSNAYRNYCEAYKDCLSEKVPAYAGISCLLLRAGLIKLEMKLPMMCIIPTYHTYLPG